MKKTVSYSKSQLLDDLGRLALMVLASVIMAVNLKSFVQAGDLVPGGFNGLTLLIQRVALRFWGLSVPFSAINFLLNAVPAVISFKLIGKRFTLFSCVVILCTSLLTDLIPPMPITDDVLLICIFGGLINGFAISLCLRGRATSGGTDFISIALSQQYDVDAPLLYGDDADPMQVLQAVKLLGDTGKTVRAERSRSDAIAYRQLLKLRNGGLEILETND